MKRIKVVFFCLVFFTWSVQAQKVVEEGVRFSGVVINVETTLPIPTVNCWKKGGEVTTSDQLGRFAINTGVGDTIHFTHVGFEPYEVVVPDTLTTGEYILAVFMTSDTVRLPEVVVVKRFRAQAREYQMNAKNNMAGVVQDAFTPTLDMTPEQNQKRILSEFAASTNKGHVDVKLGVGLESWRAYQSLKRSKRMREKPELLHREEIDLIKMIYSADRKLREKK